MKKLPKDTRIFCVATIVFWIYSLIIYLWSVTLGFCILPEFLYPVAEFMANTVIFGTPAFGFVMPFVIATSILVHSIKEKRFYWVPLTVILVNIGHTVLMYFLMVSWL